MKKKIIIFLILLILIIGIGTSLSYLKAERESLNSNNITLSNLNVNLITDISNIELNNTYPMLDTDGLNNQKINFAIRNDGNTIANYKVSLVDKTTISTLVNHDVRYQLTRTVGNNEAEVFEIKNLDDAGLIDTGSIEVGVTISYELILWIDYDSTANGAVFSKAVLVEGIQVSNLDTSGANYPELLDNMIPVYYYKISNTEGVWKKADSKNLNTIYKWYDYNDYMWANAVTVKETGTNTRDYYLNAEAGTTVEMNDITAMWVWIPRYKYVIFNGNNGFADEQQVNVIFEHGIETTGTVRCHDDILTDDDSDHSEICIDTTNNGIVNHKSTYTHPAFCFGTKNSDGSCNGEELTGFWMAKFEMSTDDLTCLESESVANCDKLHFNILSKPDQYSLRYQDYSNMFLNIRSMELSSNIHGFTQGLDANNTLLTGEINNDSNNLDTHMVKNMEWGAVAYLSQSQYGKYGNDLYTGSNKEIYMNNYDSGGVYFKTGYSAGVPVKVAETTGNYLYNNLTLGATGVGYLGAGASTTGTIYGIYDMSGGAIENVMGNIVNKNGQYSTTTYVANKINPLDKYYDFYSYNVDFHEVARLKLGDASKELKTKVINDDTIIVQTWFSDNLNVPNDSHRYFSRGYFASSTLRSLGGIFQLNRRRGSALASSTSRPVLTISRIMPWLNE